MPDIKDKFYTWDWQYNVALSISLGDVNHAIEIAMYRCDDLGIEY